MTVYPWWLFNSGTNRISCTESHFSPSPREHIDIQLHDQGFEFKEAHCKNCKDGIITEKEFNEDKALEYLKSINEAMVPCGVLMKTHLRSAPFHAAKNGDKIDFWKEKSYPCVHKYCGGNNESNTLKIQSL